MDVKASRMLADAMLNSLKGSLPYDLPLDLQTALRLLVDFQKAAFSALQCEHFGHQEGVRPDLNIYMPGLLLATRKVWVFLRQRQYGGEPYVAYNLYQTLAATFVCVNLCAVSGYITESSALWQDASHVMQADLQADANVGVSPAGWIADARQYALLVVAESRVLDLLAGNQLRSPFCERASDVLAHVRTNEELYRHVVQELTSPYGWNPAARGCGELLPPRVLHAMPLSAIKDAVQQAIAAFVNR